MHSARRGVVVLLLMVVVLVLRRMTVRVERRRGHVLPRPDADRLVE
jgi:hypothetical protein